MKLIWASDLTKNLLMIMGVLIPVSDSKFLVHRVQMSSNQEDVLQYDNLSSMSSNLTICPPIVLLLKTLLNVTFGPPIKQFVLQMSSNLRRKMAGH